MLKKKIKLLIIDDEKDICDFEKLYLEKRNYDVAAAQTGLSGIALAKKNKPEVALIDIHLSRGIDGLSTLKRLLKAYPGCKCIMATWDKEKAIAAKKLGAVDILIKPAEIEELERAVNRVAKKIAQRYE